MQVCIYGSCFCLFHFLTFHYSTWSLYELFFFIFFGLLIVPVHQPPSGCQVPPLVPLVLLQIMPVVNIQSHNSKVVLNGVQSWSCFPLCLSQVSRSNDSCAVVAGLCRAPIILVHLLRPPVALHTLKSPLWGH